MKKSKRFTEKSGFQYEKPPALVKDMDWLTPPSFIKAFGRFDLDPACPPNMPWRTATRMLTEKEDGLKSPWKGRVFCNPPYGNESWRWVDKMAEHGNGLLLIFARVETEAFFKIWSEATAVMFFPGRISFYRVDGTVDHKGKPAANALVAFGEHNYRSMLNCGFSGAVIHRFKGFHTQDGERITKL